MFDEVPHAFVERILVGVPEMQGLTFRLLAISASEFECSPNHFEGHRDAPSVIKKPPRPPLAGEDVRSP